MTKRDEIEERIKEVKWEIEYHKKYLADWVMDAPDDISTILAIREITKDLEDDLEVLCDELNETRNMNQVDKQEKILQLNIDIRNCYQLVGRCENEARKKQYEIEVLKEWSGHYRNQLIRYENELAEIESED